MAALGNISKVRHVVVAASIAGTTVLTAMGVIGDGSHPERFDTFQTVIQPGDGDEALRITERFDQDFGDNQRRGPLRVIPNDFGAPTDVVASSPDAPAGVFVSDTGFETEIRIGDPDVTLSGQHRYELAYTLPEAQLSRGFLALDVLAGDEFETDVAEVVVTGFELENPRCFVGGFGSEEQCELTRAEDGTYRARFEPLPSNTGITIEGTITGRISPVDVEPLPLPDRRETNRLPITIAVAALGVIGAVGVYVWARRRGRNEVFAGGAADAAFGSMPPPSDDGSAPQAIPTRLVPDDKLDELATIEFVPPKGIAPWEAAALLDERLGDNAVEAWLSGLAGREAIELAETDGKLTISSGPRRGELDSVDADLLDALLGGKDPYVTGTYDSQFAQAWSSVATMQRRRIADSGWWKHMPPGSGIRGGGASAFPFGIIALFAFSAVWFGSAATAFLGAFSAWPLALLLGLLFPALVAYFMYRVLLPARSAQGSALALRTESFRRFLHASESSHVEWAWEHGLLREYSGWAVALGEADAWSNALARANVPEPARASAMPAILIAHSTSIHSSRTPPQSSGGSSGGGFGGSSGGSVGGGGGGGSRGSW